MPVRQRLVAICAFPFALAAVFMSARGLFGALASLFAAGRSEPAVADRVSDYPLVEQYVQEAPWFGRGGWTYIPDNGLDILDNQFLKTAVELGVVGVIALAVFFLVPTIAALVARSEAATLSSGSCAPHWPGRHWPRPRARSRSIRCRIRCSPVSTLSSSG